MNELTTIPRTGAVAGLRAIDDPQRILDAWQAGRTEATQRSYAAAVAVFAAWAGPAYDRPQITEAPALALNWLVGLHPGEAHDVAGAWRASMLDLQLAPATINLRLSALKSFVDACRVSGFIAWRLEVKGVSARSYRDTRGPEPADVVRLLQHAAAQENKAKAARDVAMILLLGYGAALRRAEIGKLDMDKFDQRAGRLSIRGKGRREDEWRTLPPGVTKALRAWCRHRGREPGPLFLRIDRGATNLTLAQCRLTGEGVRKFLGQCGEILGCRITPHGLRHSAITAALEASNGDLRKVRAFSRHANVQTVIIYDDNRSDMGGQIANMLALQLEETVFSKIDMEPEGAI